MHDINNKSNQNLRLACRRATTASIINRNYKHDFQLSAWDHDTVNEL